MHNRVRTQWASQCMSLGMGLSQYSTKPCFISAAPLLKIRNTKLEMGISTSVQQKLPTFCRNLWQPSQSNRRICADMVLLNWTWVSICQSSKESLKQETIFCAKCHLFVFASFFCKSRLVCCNTRWCICDTWGLWDFVGKVQTARLLFIFVPEQSFEGTKKHGTDGLDLDWSLLMSKMECSSSVLRKRFICLPDRTLRPQSCFLEFCHVCTSFVQEFRVCFIQHQKLGVVAGPSSWCCDAVPSQLVWWIWPHHLVWWIWPHHLVWWIWPHHLVWWI